MLESNEFIFQDAKINLSSNQHIKLFLPCTRPSSGIRLRPSSFTSRLFFSSHSSSLYLFFQKHLVVRIHTRVESDSPRLRTRDLFPVCELLNRPIFASSEDEYSSVLFSLLLCSFFPPLFSVLGILLTSNLLRMQKSDRLSNCRKLKPIVEIKLFGQKSTDEQASNLDYKKKILLIKFF